MVIKKQSIVAYELKLPSVAMIHPVFHISLPKKKKLGPHITPIIDPPMCSKDGQSMVEPMAILGMENSEERQFSSYTSACAVG